MLTSTTKNRINSCRDILVGKIPDPKGQIDQITNALVYKFMDDQDRMSRELGYETSFFIGDYEQYAWSRLFDAKLTNQDKANLYIEWLDRLSRADHLPDLFKQIFKDAYLPFRDANTIVMFLTEINGFDYHHSEELGNAFEYLLSIMGSQGDAGQFRTPRHIIEFLVDVVDPQKTETILDPACGTAWFLVEAFKHISAKWDLGVQDIAKLAESITGVDIDPGMAKIARVNLYLHGFKTPKITENDTLTNEKLWWQKYDVILANPPFMTPKGGIQPHDKFAIRANRAEVLFTDYIAEHLKLHGRAGIIVPEGIIFQWSNAYKDLRKMLVDGWYLWAVVSLPSGVFQPYSGVKTSILFLDRERARKTDKILFVKVKADGYDLGAQRRKIGYEYNGEEIRLKLQNTANDQTDVVSANLLWDELTFDYLGQKRVLSGFQNNDLPTALYLLQIWKQNIDQNTQHLPEQALLDLYSDIAHLVEKSKIVEGGDYNLSGDRYITSLSLVNTEHEMVQLQDIIETISPNKKIQKSDFLPNWLIPIIDQSQDFISWYTNDLDAKIIHSKPLVIFWDHTCAIKYIEFPFAQWADGIKILDTKENLLPKYLYYNLFYKPLKSDGYQRHFSKLKEYKIPLPPLKIQEQIVSELDGYQRIIDGARAVVENYKPTIKIDPEWEMVELGDILEIERGASPRPIEKFITNSDEWVNWVKIGDTKWIWKVIYDTEEKITLDWAAKSRKVDVGDFILSNSMSFGRPYIMWTSWYVHDGWLILRNNNEQLSKDYLYYILSSTQVYNQFESLATWWVVRNLNSALVKTVKIPLPPIEIQQSIVDRIEEEQRLVDANRRLIEIYEGKIREKMDEVWGVE